MSAYDTLKAALTTLFTVPCPPGNTGEQAATGIANAVSTYHADGNIVVSGTGTVNPGAVGQLVVQLVGGASYLVFATLLGAGVDTMASYLVQCPYDSVLNISAGQLVFAAFNGTGSVYVRAQDGSSNWFGWNTNSSGKMIIYFNNAGAAQSNLWYSVRRVD